MHSNAFKRCTPAPVQLVHGPEGLGEGSAVVGGVQVHDVNTGNLDNLLDNMLAYG